MITESEAVDLDNEIYVLGDFNINLLFRDKYVLNKSKGITKLCTHLHPAPSTSTQLISTSTQLHPALSNTLNNTWTKILHVIGQFPQV